MTEKPKVLFPFTEAGMGHIMPMRSIADAFEKKYGDVSQIIYSNFFSENGNIYLKKFEEAMAREVRKQNKFTPYGFFSTASMGLFGTKISSWAVMKHLVPGAYEAAVAHMEELQPDMVVSTHWATNYYATMMQKKPLTVMYCPDAYVCSLFRYPCDLCMVSMKTGYDYAMKHHKERFNEDNFKLVPFSIRKEAFSVSLDKRENRRALGWDENKFTVVLAEGGYGIGKMQKICELLIARDAPINLVPVCGKNEALYQHFLTLPVGKKLSFYPQGFTANILQMIAAADLFCGKSGNIIAEPCFFGVPAIITKHATDIERHIGEYYVEYVGSAMHIFDAAKVVDKIEEFVLFPDRLTPYRERALAHRENHYGSEQTADYIYELLRTRFAHLPTFT